MYYTIIIITIITVFVIIITFVLITIIIIIIIIICCCCFRTLAKHRPLYYRNDLPLRYLVYRKRGSVPTYVHEAKLNCLFSDNTLEHSSISEMVLHLNRDDELFISVDDLDKDFLSAEPGSHLIGLFEI